MQFSQIKPVSLRDQVVEQVRTAIIEGRMKPNDHIIESTLTRELGVSRTPVREALILLEREGLVVSTPNRGAFVRAFDDKAITEIFSSRINLENFAAERVIDKLAEEDFLQLESLIAQQEAAIARKDSKTARSIDMDFHWHIIRRTEHSWIIRNWEELVAQIAALLYMRAEGMVAEGLEYNEYLATSDHGAIVAAYRSGDVAAVKRENQRINMRVSNECHRALAVLEAQT